MKRLVSYVGVLTSVLFVQTASAQTWTPVAGAPPISATNPLLLTDGSVMVQNGGTNNYYKLTPDIHGNYATGSWSQIASTIPTWVPLYMGSEVMPDGRVFVIGGEYNNGLDWTGQSGIYDPVLNIWTMLKTPWANSGDTATAVLPNGLVYIAHALSNDTAAFNPATNQYIHPYGQISPTYNNEAGLTLLPNGNLFRVNCWSSGSAQVFNSTTLGWTKLTMPYNVVDLDSAEIGPAIVQYNGQVIQFGGNGANVVFDPSANRWITAPSFPVVSGTQINVADGGAVLLPNGNVLVDADGQHAYFYIWNGSTLTPVQGPPDADYSVGFAGEFLNLPNGQVLLCDQSSDVELYSPGGAPQPGWAPTITTCPSQLHEAASYTISGTQFNGFSQASAYGDDDQSNTNYPLIRITMKSTGHVFYVKEYSPSTMGIATGKTIVSTHFSMPSNIELGAGTVQVVTNGIASTPYPVQILPPLQPDAVSLYPAQGTAPIGNLSDVLYEDGQFYSGESQLSSAGQVCSVESDFNVGLGISTIKVFASAEAPSGVTEQLFAYNWSTKLFDFIASVPFGSGVTSISGSPTNTNSNYVSSNGVVRVIVRGVLPTHISPNSFRLYVDSVSLGFG